MTRLYIEAWDPSYGSPLETDESMAPDEAKVDVTVEQSGPWAPIPGRDDEVPVVAFVDGVRRVDARLTLDDPDAGPIPGLCGSYGVGAVLWRRSERRSEFADMEIHRMALLTAGREVAFPALGPQLAYRSEAVADRDPASLIRKFHGAMRDAEARVAEDLAQRGFFVVADGPINILSATEKVGYIKSHRAPYLPAEEMGIIAQLGRGERTPLFTIGDYRRYSWYLRLAERGSGHSWAGVVRCEASAGLPLERVVALADRTAAILPAAGSAQHLDPRAPQNLVPIAALERELRRRLGEAALVHRRLRAALAQTPDVDAGVPS
jgi:hypothetical protein